MLIAIGVWLLVGCVYIPTFDRTMNGTNGENKVGKANSSRPIRIGSATMSDAIRILGEPQAGSAASGMLIYNWTSRRGVVVWPLCFASYPDLRERELVLRFNERGVLQSFDLRKY